MNNQKPYYIRKINIPITDEIIERESQEGFKYMRKAVDTLQQFFNSDYTQINWTEYRNNNQLEYYIYCEHPNEEGSWV